MGALWVLTWGGALGCAGAPRDAVARSSVVAAAGSIGTIQLLHQTAYTVAAAKARSEAREDGSGFTGYEQRMLEVDRVFWARSRALQATSAVLYRMAAILDGGRELGREDLVLTVQVLGVLVDLLGEGAAGLEPVPIPPAVLVLMNTIAALLQPEVRDAAIAAG